MSEMPRLVDDPHTPDEVQEGLRAVSTATESYDVEAGLRRLQAVLAAGGAAAATGSAAAATGSAAASTGAGKLWLALALIGALGGGGVIAHGVWGGEDGGPSPALPEGAPGSEAPVAPEGAPGSEAPAPLGVNGAGEPVGDPAGPPLPLADPPTGPALAPAPAEPADSPPRRPRSATTTSSAEAGPTAEPPDPAGADALREETLHLARVRAALERSPAEALRLAREGQRRFTDGVFGEERQALIVMALDRSGQHERARRAARAFIERYPNGPLTARVRAISESD